MTLSKTTSNTVSESPPCRHLYLGLTGRMGSGKGEAAAILIKKGFKYISLSDMVRREAEVFAHSVSRREMQNIGNRMRREGGAGILGIKVFEHISRSPETRWVIDGIRNPAEVAALKKLNRFFLIGITAPVQVLLDRLSRRGRSTDRVSLSELQKRLDREWGINEPADGQRVGDCMAVTDFQIENSTSLENLSGAIDSIILKTEVMK